MEPKKALLVFLTLFVTANSVPIVEWTSSQCARQCVRDPRLVRFDAQNTYYYSLQTETQLLGQSPITTTAAVRLQALSDCDLALSLSDARVDSLPEPALESSPLVFALNDGLVTDVCPTSDDQKWTLDVKKGVVSALQMSAQSLSSSVVSERDIIGDCETRYDVIGQKFGKTQIRKRKDLHSCRNRQLTSSALFAPSFESRIQALPILNASYECVQTLEGDLITGVTCVEQFSLWGSEVSGSNRLNLRFERKENGVENHRASIRRSERHLLMSPRMTGSGRPEETVHVLRQLCNSLESRQMAPTVEAIHSLIESISNERDLEKVWKSVRNGELCSSQQLPDFFLDAVAHSGSRDAVRVLLKARDTISSAKNDYLFTLLALNSNPNKESAKELISILKNGSGQQILGASGYIHNLLAQTSDESIRGAALDALLERLNGKSDVIVIKAIQNIGTNGKTRQKLIAIAKNSQMADKVRSAAVKALDSSQTETEKEELLSLVKDSSLSNEIRLNAYKSLVLSKASEKHMKEIQRMIEPEAHSEIKQYITSHQKNLRETSDPHKRHLAARSVAFPEPQNKWFGISNNFEASFMIDALGVGAVAEVDVIHGRDSHAIPRSVVLNVSLPVFGREVNLVEVEIRQKGMEHVLKQKFESLAKKTRMAEVLSALTEVMERAAQQIRSRDQQLQIHAKFDGKTVLSFDSSDLELNSQHIWNQLKQKVSQRLEIDSGMALQPVNTRIQLPTTSGIPLQLRMNATIVSSLKSSVKINSQTYEALMAPSFGVQFETGLEFESNGRRKSVEMKARLSSSPEWDSKAEIKDNRILNAKINVPKERQTLVTMETEILENGVKKSWNSSKQKKCSKAVLGLKMCSEKSSQSFEVFVEKEEKNLNTFELQMALPDMKSDSKQMRLYFNTPNSETDRQVALEVNIESPEKWKRAVKASLRSPSLRYAIEGALVNDEKETALKMDVEANGKKAFSVDLGLEAQNRGQKRELRPRVRVMWSPEKEAIALSGVVSVMKGRKNALMVQLDGNQKQFLKGSLVREGERKSSDLRVSTDVNLKVPQMEARVVGSLDKGAKHLENELNIEYKIGGQRKESLKTSLKIQNLSQSSLTKVSVFGELTSTQFPKNNLHLSYNLLRKPEKQIENEFTVSNGKNLEHRVHVLHVTKVTQADNERRVENTLDVEISPLKVNYELRANAVQTGNKMQAEMVGKDRNGRKENDVKASAVFTHVERSPLHLTLEMNLKTNSQEFKYSDELKQEKKAYRGKTSVEWSPNQKATLDYVYNNDDKHALDFKLTTPENHVIRHSGLLKLSREGIHVKSRLNAGESQLYSLETRLHANDESNFELNALGYRGRASANPYRIPQQLELEVETPREVSHKTYLEYVPKNALKVKSETKSGSKAVFSLDSAIARQKARVAVFSTPLEGKLDLNGEKSSIDIKSPIHDWNHASTLEFEPKFELKSKTNSKGKEILSLNSNQNSISVNLPQLESHLSAEVDKRQRKAALTLRARDLKHDTSIDALNGVRVNSETLMNGNQWNSLQYRALNGVHALNTRFPEVNVECEGKHWTSSESPALKPFLRVKVEKSGNGFESRLEKQLNGINFESRVHQSGSPLAEVNAQYQPTGEKRFQWKSKRYNGLLSANQKDGHLEWTSPDCTHATHVQWNPISESGITADSKTKIYGNNYAILGKHNLRMSLLSLKTDSSELMAEMQPIDRKSRLAAKNGEWNHETSMDWNRNWKMTSKTQRNGENVLNLESELSQVANSPSIVEMRVGSGTQVRARVQPLGVEKSANIWAKSPRLNHESEMRLNSNAFSLKSRTEDQNGRNVVKIDSFLSPKERSHLTWNSMERVVNLEVERQKALKLEISSPTVNHVTHVRRSGNGVEIESKTQSEKRNILNLNSRINDWNQESSLDIDSPRVVTKIIATPSQRRGSLELRTNSLNHKSELNSNAFESKTQYNNELMNRIQWKLANNKHQMELEVPHFVANAQLAAEGARVDYKSKIGHKRHVLGSVLLRDGFHSEIAWDADRDANQKLSIDLTALPSTSSGLWSGKQRNYEYRVNYAGNEAKIMSKINSDWMRGPNEVTFKYSPAFEAKKDSIEVHMSHVINKNEMQCALKYALGGKTRFDAKVNGNTINDQSGEGVSVTVETHAPFNPELEVKLTLNEKHALQSRNPEVSLEIVAQKTSLSERYALRSHVKKSDVIRGVASVETPTFGPKDFEIEVRDKEIVFFSQNSNSKELEFSAKIVENGLKMDLNSNVKQIPSVSVSAQLNKRNAGIAIDSEGERVLDFSVERNGDEINSENGIEVSGKFETKFWPKIDSNNRIKVSRRVLDFQSVLKKDSKEIFNSHIDAKKESGVWTGSALLAADGTEVARLALKSQSSPSELLYSLSAKSRDFDPIKVEFSSQRIARNEKKASVSFCNGNQCLSVTSAIKTRSNSNIPESALISVQKLGSNLEIKTSLMEEMESTGGATSLLGLNSGSAQKYRNGLQIDINGHKLGFDSIVSSFNSGKDVSIKLFFPSKTFIQMKSDYRKTSDLIRSRFQIQRALESPIIDSEMSLENSNQRVKGVFALTSRQLRNPKRIEFEVRKDANPISAKALIDLSRDPNNALTVELDANTHNRNTTVSINVSARDRKRLDLKVGGHVSQKTFGINYVNTNRRGQKSEGMLFARLLNENKFEANLKSNDKSFRISGIVSKSGNEVQLKVLDEKRNQENDLRIALHKNCIQLEDAAGSQDQKYELCLNLGANDEKVVTLALDSHRRRQFEAQIDLKVRQQLRIALNWNPEILNSGSQSYDQSILAQHLKELLAEVKDKAQVIGSQLDSEVLLPIVSLFSDEFQDIFQELQKNFTQNRVFQEMTSRLERAADYLPDLDNVVQSVSQKSQQLVRNARKACKRSEMCYKALYSIENYGLESVWDLLQSNAHQLAKSAHTVVMETKNTLKMRFPNVWQSISDWFDDYRQSIRAIIDSNETLSAIVSKIEEIVAQISKEDFEDISLESIKQSLGQIFDILWTNENQKMLVWDPKRGKVEFVVKSPVISSRRMRSLSEGIKSRFA